MAPYRCLLLFTFLITIYVEQCKAGDGEKLRIDPEVLEKVVQFSNLTRRDRTEKNVNFAWRVTIKSTQPTTPNPEFTSTLSPEQNKKNSEIYDKLFAQLAYTLRDKTYLDRWLTEMDKGYHIFLYELQKRDKLNFFKKYEDDMPFEGTEGENLWVCMVDFLTHLKSKEEFLNFVNSLSARADEFEIKTTQSEAQRNTSLNEAYNMMFLQLAYSLRHHEYRHRWMASHSKGFTDFLRDLKDIGPKWFIRPMPDDETFQGAKGALFWENIIAFLQNMGQPGFDSLLKKIDSLPNKFGLKDLGLPEVDLPDAQEILKDCDKTGTLTPINWDLYTRKTKPMYFTEAMNSKEPEAMDVTEPIKITEATEVTETMKVTEAMNITQPTEVVKTMNVTETSTEAKRQRE